MCKALSLHMASDHRLLTMGMVVIMIRNEYARIAPGSDWQFPYVRTINCIEVLANIPGIIVPSKAMEFEEACDS